AQRKSQEETLESTIEHLLKLKPPFNVNNSEKVKNLKIVDKEHQAMFKKSRVVQYNISYGYKRKIQTISQVNNMKFLQINSLNVQKVKKEKEDNLSSRIPHKFSFSASKQDSYVKPILENVEKALFRFVVKNRDYIPSDTDSDISVLSTLALELVDFLGDEDAFESLLMIKRNLSSELAEQYALLMKRKHENNEDELQERKRHITDEELGELIDFALNIVNKLESENKEHLNQIVRLCGR
ncbi:20496_t:CDS:2, partial [Funneliformis geosporum]